MLQIGQPSNTRALNTIMQVGRVIQDNEGCLELPFAPLQLNKEAPHPWARMQRKQIGPRENLKTIQLQETKYLISWTRST
jgi:hypothetical protein